MISGVISPLIWVISTVTLLLITLLITTHEAPSRDTETVQMPTQHRKNWGNMCRIALLSIGCARTTLKA